VPEASVVGEIVPGAEFYDYNAKYHSDASIPIIPAKLSKSEEKQIREMAIAAFRACDCAGLARVDFLMEPARKGSKPRIYLNEINTMPIHQHQHVPKTLEGQRHLLQAADRPPDCTCS